MDEDIRASWEEQSDQAPPSPKELAIDNTNPFTTKRDDDVNFAERYEVVGCIELSVLSPEYSRFKFVYFFVALAEQFGFYWITLIGTQKYGYKRWLDDYIMFSGIALLVSTVCSPIMGRLSDRYGRKKVILISIFVQMLPYIPIAAFGEDQMLNFLYNLPITGICGSITSLNGVMKAYVVDNFSGGHCKYTVSAFAKLLSIYAGAGLVCAVIIYTIIGGNARSFFFEDDLQQYVTTEYVMYSAIGLHLLSFLLFAIVVPESLSKAHKLAYITKNPLHGLCEAVCRNGVIFSAALLTFLCGFAQTGIVVLVEDLFLKDWDEYDPDTDSNDLFVNLFTITDHKWGDPWSLEDILEILSEEIIIYGLFLFTLGITLICSPCCIHMFCGRAMVNTLCSIMLMLTACGMMVAVIMLSQWYIAIVALFCGLLFAFGEIAFVFLNGTVIRYMHSRQYGISYGVLHGAYSLSRALAPYTFYLVFTIFNRSTGPVELSEEVLGDGNTVVFMAVFVGLIAVMITLWTRRKMRLFEEDRLDPRKAQQRRSSRSNLENGQIEMQPVPPAPAAGPGSDYGSGHGMAGDSLDWAEGGAGQPPPPNGGILYPPANHRAFDSHSEQLYELGSPALQFVQPAQPAFAQQSPAASQVSQRPNLDYQPGSQHGSNYGHVGSSSIPQRPFGGRLPSEPGSSYYGSARSGTGRDVL